jgi:hypothetical protein
MQVKHRPMLLKDCYLYLNTQGRRFSYHLFVVKETLAALKQERKRYHEKNAILVFTSIGGFKDGKVVLPTYVLRTREEILSSFSSFKIRNGIYFTQDAWKQYGLRHRTQSVSKEHLDSLVQALQKMDLFAWDYDQDGCFARADMVIQFLMVMGVPSENLFKHYVFPSTSNSLTLKGRSVGWQYHVAPVIKLANKTDWVIDPVVKRDGVLSLKEWVQSLVASENDNYLDLGFQDLEEIPCLPTQAVSFATSQKGGFFGSRSAQGIFVEEPFTVASRAAMSNCLAYIRTQFEQINGW